MGGYLLGVPSLKTRLQICICKTRLMLLLILSVQRSADFSSLPGCLEQSLELVLVSLELLTSVKQQYMQSLTA